MHAVSRLLAKALDAPDASVVEAALVYEARALFEVDTVLLLAVDLGDHLAQVVACEGCPASPAVSLPLTHLPAFERLDGPATYLDSNELMALRDEMGLDVTPGVALVVPMPSRGVADHLLLLADRDPGRLDAVGQVDLAQGFASAAAGGLAQLRLTEEQLARTSQQAALARAAKTLNETLDEGTVLDAICRESRAILDADSAAAYISATDGALVIEAAVGLAEEHIGRRMAPGEGLSGRVALADRAMLTNDYQRIARPAPDSPFVDVRSCLAVPMHWDGKLRGVLSLGFSRTHFVGAGDLALLEAFAEIAAAACRNASAASGLAHAARTDGLTGCLNHAALQETLVLELERAAQTGQNLSLILLDVDHFKQVNEQAGHLAGDEVLRRVGRSLRLVTRPGDTVARYGGDEFAIVVLNADEDGAHALATRALMNIRTATVGVAGPLAIEVTAGVAAANGRLDAPGLLHEADRALLQGKHRGERGLAGRASLLPATGGTLSAPERGENGAASPPRPVPAEPPERRLPPTDTELPQQETRRLMMANALGARLAAMVDPDEIVDAVVDELHRAFGYYLCAAIKIHEEGYVFAPATRGGPFQRLGISRWTQPREDGVIGRALRAGTVTIVNDVSRDADFVQTSETEETRSELVAPLWVGDRLWGALNIEETEVGAFTDDDARLLSTVADQTASALRSAELYAQLDRAYLGTAAALATALEVKDSYTASHASSITDWAREVGRRRGMNEHELRNLHYGAIFHDIGKISVPEAVLNKAGPLTAEEWEIVRRHTVVGEQILAPVDFLAEVLPIVRHEHERWDGRGYPDGLAGEAIPLGARIVLACDAFHAMTSDRPYRKALPVERAMAELSHHAGTQFDPAVVDALLSVLRDDAAFAPEG